MPAPTVTPRPSTNEIILQAPEEEKPTTTPKPNASPRETPPTASEWQSSFALRYELANSLVRDGTTYLSLGTNFRRCMDYTASSLTSINPANDSLQNIDTELANLAPDAVAKQQGISSITAEIHEVCQERTAPKP